ncbi:MAG TPA: hypothetical protein VFG10_15335 [Saprospiraceae bacterium]|nr:hypothetical protein [Saprospiraceae bacterium]
MKNMILMLVVAISFSGGFMIMSCQSSEKKVEAAKEDVKDAKEELSDAQKKANEEAAKAAREEEWRVFKENAKAQIEKNDARIVELRLKLQKPGKALDGMYASRIEALETKNKELKARIDVYEKNQSDWDTFKREFNHDMDELGQALRDFTVDNKK